MALTVDGCTRDQRVWYPWRVFEVGAHLKPASRSKSRSSSFQFWRILAILDRKIERIDPVFYVDHEMERSEDRFARNMPTAPTTVKPIGCSHMRRASRTCR